MSRKTPHTPRKKILVDPSLQLSVAASVITVFLALTAIFVGAYMVTSQGGGDIDGPSSQAANSMGVLVVGAYFLVVLVAVVYVAVVSTQRIAGPAFVIQRALEGIPAGELDLRLDLRDKDHLGELSAAALQVREFVKAEAARTQALHEELDQALAKGEIDRARTLLSSFRGGEQPSEPAQAA